MNRINVSFFLPLAIIVFIVFSLLFGILVLWPKYDEIKTFNNNITSRTEELQYLKKYFSSLAKVDEELKTYSPEIAKIASGLPDDPAFSSLFNFIQKSCSQSGVVLKEISSFTITESVNMPSVKESDTVFIITGSFASLKSFLSILESSARMIEVKNIVFSPLYEAEKMDIDKFSINLRIKVYSY